MPQQNTVTPLLSNQPRRNIMGKRRSLTHPRRTIQNHILLTFRIQQLLQPVRSILLPRSSVPGEKVFTEKAEIGKCLHPPLRHLIQRQRRRHRQRLHSLLLLRPPSRPRIIRLKRVRPRTRHTRLPRSLRLREADLPPQPDVMTLSFLRDT